MGNWGNLIFLTFFTLIGLISSSSNTEDCAKGVPYWCEHVMNAKKCNAVDFCIQTVWQTHNVRVDNNPLCDDCKDWVTQARDFIAKNETSAEVIRSLELSCQLCPDENGRKKCESLIEDNIREIFKLLESAMNPNGICSAIHLCNNPSFTNMFANPPHNKKNDQPLMPFTCGQCSLIGSHLEKKFKCLNNDEVLEGTLMFCGETSSFSDSCMNVVLKNFDDIYSYLHKKITRQNLCHATCDGRNQYSEGIIDIENSEVPCKLCEQLMLHLRELLIANTTEIEFKNLLQGFCTQIPKLTDECISITEQYYDQIFKFLESGLDANKTCVMIGICDASERVYKSPSMPLLSSDAFSPLNHKSVEKIYDENSIRLQNDGKLCTACEYAMNLVHEEMGKNTVEDKIVEYARKSCKILPRYVKQCEETMDTFGDEIANAIYHSTDPRLICPLVKLCPPNNDLSSLEKNAVGEKPSCSFCLFAIQEIKDVIQSNNTRDSIEAALDKLCDHLSDNLKSQCVQFVKTHSGDIVDMMLANFTPQEACVFIKLCNKNEPVKKIFNNFVFSSGSSESSESSSEGDLIANPQCQLCKELIKILEQRVINIKSKDEIRQKLEESCHKLKRFSSECKKFVDKYSDRIVDLVSSELEPEQVCRDLIFCVTEKQRELQDYDSGLDIMRLAFDSDEDEIEVDDSSELEVKSSPGCTLCEFVIQTIENDLNDKKTDENIKRTVKNICSKMPATISKQCNEFVDYYFDMIIALIETSPPADVCNRMKLCPNSTLEDKLQEIKKDIYTCAVCRGVVESIDSIIEDPNVDTNLENFEEKICMKFAGKFKNKCHNLASTYGVAIINLLKNMTESDQICYKFKLCEFNVGGQVTLH